MVVSVTIAQAGPEENVMMINNCKYCGGRATVQRGGLPGIYVVCEECKQFKPFPPAKDEETAVKKWNRYNETTETGR